MYTDHYTQQIFTEDTLAQYTGEDPSKPIYLSVRGHVFDVSNGARFYVCLLLVYFLSNT